MNSASADGQLPLFNDERRVTPGELEAPSNKSEAALSNLNRVRISKRSQSATAPDKIRMKVNVAASIVVCLSASRQSKELLANAIIASDVSMKSRVDFIAHEIRPPPVGKRTGIVGD